MVRASLQRWSVRIETVNYEVEWEFFERGSSMTLPCLNPALARKQVVAAMALLRYSVVTQVVIVEGIRGLRIWRT